MKSKWLFRFTKPDVLPPGGTPITADEAEQHLLQQLETKQRPPADVLWELARLYSFTHRHDQAFARVQQLVELAETPETKAHCYLAMGQLMEQVGDFKMAIKYYSQALSLEPTNNQVWYFIHNNLGYCLNHFQRYEDAVPYLQRAITIDPLRHNAYKNMGTACEGVADYAQAAAYYIKAVQTNASDSRALRHLELLVEKHPGVIGEVKDFDRHLEGCRMAVRYAAQVSREMIADQPRLK